MAHTIPCPVLLTRPLMQSERFASTLKARFGDQISVVVSSVLEIQFLDIVIDLNGIDGVIFTSENGVRGFANAMSRRDVVAYCVGDRTAETAGSVGFKAFSAGGSAENLIEMLVDQAKDQKLLYARGVHTTRDLSAGLAPHGISVTEAIVYDQVSKPLNATAKTCLGNQHRVFIPLFSPRSAKLLAQEFTDQMTAPRIALCLSTAVEDACGTENYDQTYTCEMPHADSIIELLTDLLEST